MKQTRRRVIQSSIAIALGSTLTGCLGGGGGGGNDSEGNNSTNATASTNQSTTNKSTNESRNTTANSSSTNSTNATSAQSAAVLGAEPEFREQEMSISLEGETSPDRVSLQTPNGDEFARYEPSEYESAATFTLIRSSSSQFGYKRYPFGEWTATAFRDGSKIDERSYELEPSFSVSGVEARSGEMQITFENIGTAPAPITAARVYNAKMNPGPDQFGGGFVDSSSITPPGSTITIETRLLGFRDQFSVGENKSASDYEGEYCTGNSYPVTISHRIFSEIRETTGSLIFGGGPVEGPQGNAACSEYTLNSGANVSVGNETANGTGANVTNATANMTNTTGANRTNQTVTFTTTGNQSSTSNSSTSSSSTTTGETATNKSGS